MYRYHKEFVLNSSYLRKKILGTRGTGLPPETGRGVQTRLESPESSLTVPFLVRIS